MTRPPSHDAAIAARKTDPSRWLPMVFIAPVTLYLLAFQFYPLLQQFFLSVTSTSLLNPGSSTFVGADNYRELLTDPEFGQSLRVTVVYTVICVVGSIFLGLMAALLLDRPFRGRGLARALVTVPWAAPPVAAALIFTWMYNAQYGLFSRLAQFFGFASGGVNWLDEPSMALPAILITTLWQIFPFSAVVILAALQGVPSELREAAVIDGADRFSVFKAVVWPTIRPTVTLLTLLITVWSLRRFDVIWLMTQGGPLGETNTLVIDLYRRAFVYLDLGKAAAVGVIGLVIAVLVTVVYFWVSQRTEAATGKR
ncbi:MAG: sugar ABC transporter permease [Chelatococcus sp.]|jgi:multiple sugar transport system permease protein|uniref:carbohydrate ABC transporter permease n=1 Tax=unclassified Chelatococcus TaxID=2638111 RepID=UPI001BCF6A62|nr:MULTISPECIES: sugar ABC transporter permease [unclassified Chelatococcus]CAH1670980.1 Carbohydrate ABC transporter membrane protein 1 (CUT1 family) [Hyphomicrobiales bacterium]MBS7739133.1 sugar ABC transporter permease [Chelatococcus sp. HY11]MBX3536929.1 sugar ABC transporter permease [Chelatococcus sp.]MBX3543623.1 sugar ABC transporter permease [Chelatococcus sp.]MCO5076335.1 sugar ABC transporter permease [Chelatococcus sp.]